MSEAELQLAPCSPAARSAVPERRKHTLRPLRAKDKFRDAALGISHRLDQPAYLAVRKDGRLVTAVLPGMAPERPAKRGVVDGFSDESKRRLVSILHSIDRNCRLPIMLTVTFPEEIKVGCGARRKKQDPAESKDCLRAFLKVLEREHPAIAVLWRLEAQPKASNRLGRPQPHFHLLVWNAWFDLDWLNSAWTETVWSVLGIDECLSDEQGRLVKEKHRKSGTNAERVRKWAGVVYCAKAYIAKDEEYPMGKVGRHWGWHAFDRLPIAEETRIELTPMQVAQVRVNIASWMRKVGIESEYLIREFWCDNPTAFAARLLAGTSRMTEKQYHDSGRNYG